MLTTKPRAEQDIRPGRTVASWIALSFLVGIAGAGCVDMPPCPVDESAPTNVVLTFDDGPLSADIADPSAASDPDTLLDSLRTILGTLEQRKLHAVFYIKGPGNDDAANALRPLFLEGLNEIRDGRHILGYHSYSHDPETWIQPFAPRVVVQANMLADLDQLEQFLDETLAPTGLSRESMFHPIFRPPFGTGGTGLVAAQAAAAAKGWICHGYRIDSFDWTSNANAGPRFSEVVPTDSEEERANYVVGRLETGIATYHHGSTPDVLFHVNSFTAAYLDEWIDTLRDACIEQDGREPTFNIPDCYLNTADPPIDTAAVWMALLGW